VLLRLGQTQVNLQLVLDHNQVNGRHEELSPENKNVYPDIHDEMFQQRRR
jgi:hypothetical protein